MSAEMQAVFVGAALAVAGMLLGFWMGRQRW